MIVLIIGLVRGWFMSPEGLLAADGREADSPERIAIHRAAIVEAVRRMCTDPGRQAPAGHQTPVTAFGADVALGVPGVALTRPRSA